MALTLTLLKAESDLLHLLFHRNKNQHRSSKWWKWLGMLRRSIKKLLDPSASAGVEKRVEYMRRVLVPSCYTAFTSVVANPQFAPLGLTLLGALARVHKVIGVEKGGEGEGEGEEEKGVEVVRGGTVVELDMEDLGETIVRREEVVEEAEDENVVTQKETLSEVLVMVEDLPTGEPSKEGATVKDAKRRDEKATKKKKRNVKPVSSLSPLRMPSLPLAKEEKPKIKSKRKSSDKEWAKKKKRKRGDEIDDLFAGLL